MGSTDVLVNVGSLQSELERAKTNLKGLNDNIRRIIGREPNDIAPQLRGDRKRLFGVVTAAAGGGGGGQPYHHHHNADADRRRGHQLTGADFAAVDRNNRRRHQDSSPPPPSKRRYQQQQHNHQQSNHNTGSSEATGGGGGIASTKSVFSRLSGPPSVVRASFQNHRHNHHTHHGREQQQPQQRPHHLLKYEADEASDAADDDNGSAAAASDDDGDDDMFAPAAGGEPQPVAVPARPQRLHSRVIRELPTRQEIVAAQGTDPAARARNRRMFGSLLGTLQKFCQEESRLKPKEDRKAQIELKLEAQQLQERETMRRERADLFANRKRQLLEIKQLESKMARMRELAAWEAAMRPLGNFIRTKTKPRLYYLPKVLDGRMTERLAESREELEKTIAKKSAEVTDELAAIEVRCKAEGANKHGEDGNHAVDNGAAASAAIKSEFGKHDRRTELEDNEEDDEEEAVHEIGGTEEATLVPDDDDDEAEEEAEDDREMISDIEPDVRMGLKTKTRSVVLVKRERVDDKATAVRVLVENDLMDANAMTTGSGVADDDEDGSVSQLKEEEEEEDEEGAHHSVSE